MATIKLSIPATMAALVFTACDRPAPANGANAARTPAAPTMDALLTLEKSAYEAWKSKDAGFWDTFLAHKFVGYGASGRLDKASATREFAGADCEIGSYTLSDAQMQLLGDDAALITHKLTLDGTCGGQPVPAGSRAASVYVRDGDTWKGAFHAEAPVVDPQKAVGAPVREAGTSKAVEAGPGDLDAGTAAMFEAEKAIWEAWGARDGGRLEALTAGDISFINIFGTYFATKAEALKDWTEHGCEIESVSVTDPAGTMLSPTVGILTFRGGADGTCYGRKIGPIWGTSVYVRDGGEWKWTFGINLPATSTGA